MPSVIEAFEVDAGISGSSVKTSGQCDSSLLEKSALLSFLIEERGRVMVVLQPAGGGGLSACLRHESRRLPEAAKTIHLLSFVRVFVISHMSTRCISLEVPRNALRVFLITVP